MSQTTRDYWLFEQDWSSITRHGRLNAGDRAFCGVERNNSAKSRQINARDLDVIIEAAMKVLSFYGDGIAYPAGGRRCGQRRTTGGRYAFSTDATVQLMLYDACLTSGERGKLQIAGRILEVPVGPEMLGRVMAN